MEINNIFVTASFVQFMQVKKQMVIQEFTLLHAFAFIVHFLHILKQNQSTQKKEKYE